MKSCSELNFITTYIRDVYRISGGRELYFTYSFVLALSDAEHSGLCRIRM